MGAREPLGADYGRAAAAIRMPAATPTFSDSTAAVPGTATCTVQARRLAFDIPSASLPITRHRGRGRGVSNTPAGAR